MTLPVTTPSTLLERTSALLPYLRERAMATEQARRVLPETFDALARAGVFKMTAPKKYGGDEVSFQTQCDVLAEVARGCPSSSWVATIFSAMSWLAGTYPDEAQEEIFADGDPRISGVFSPTGTAVRKDGGFVVNGKWGFNTGGQGSNWTVLNTILTEGDGLPMCVIAPTARARSAGRLERHRHGGHRQPHRAWRRTSSCRATARCRCPIWSRARAPRTDTTPRNPYFSLPLARGAHRQRRRHAARHGARRVRYVHGAAAGPADRLHQLHEPGRSGRHAPAGRRGVAHPRLVRRARAPRLRAARRPRRHPPVGTRPRARRARTSPTRPGWRGRRWTSCSTPAARRRSSRTSRSSASSATSRRWPTTP